MDPVAYENSSVDALMDEKELMKCIATLNLAMKDQPWFICDGCNRIHIGDAFYEHTSKWGEDRPFCGKCINWCSACQKTYVDSLAYQHKECESYFQDVYTKEYGNTRIE